MTTKPEPFDEIDQAKKGPVEPSAAPKAGKKVVDVTEQETSQSAGQTSAAAQPTQSKSATLVEPDAWEKKAAEYLAGWKRAQADYQNLRKSVEQEKVDMVKYANEGLLQELTPLMAHFNMAFKHLDPKEAKNAWVRGFEHIAQNFKQVLQQNGVVVMETLGKPFDPSVHESVGEVDSTEPEGTIVEELSPGCMLHGKVMQAAKVKISKGKSN